jgi:hypothetical protein
MMPIDFTELSAVGIVPIVVALVQVAKQINLPAKYAPIMAIVFGVVMAFFLEGGLNTHMGHTVLNGVIYGLSASGLYSGTKATSEYIKKEKEDPEEFNRG